MLKIAMYAVIMYREDQKRIVLENADREAPPLLFFDYRVIEKSTIF